MGALPREVEKTSPDSRSDRASDHDMDSMIQDLEARLAVLESDRELSFIQGHSDGGFEHDPTSLAPRSSAGRENECAPRGTRLGRSRLSRLSQEAEDSPDTVVPTTKPKSSTKHGKKKKRRTRTHHSSEDSEYGEYDSKERGASVSLKERSKKDRHRRRDQDSYGGDVVAYDGRRRVPVTSVPVTSEASTAPAKVARGDARGEPQGSPSRARAHGRYVLIPAVATGNLAVESNLTGEDGEPPEPPCSMSHSGNSRAASQPKREVGPGVRLRRSRRRRVSQTVLPQKR